MGLSLEQRPCADLAGNDQTGLVNTENMLNVISDWKRYLLDTENNSNEEFDKHGRTGRSLGSDRFIEMAESLPARKVKKKKPGAKVIDDGS